MAVAEGVYCSGLWTFEKMHKRHAEGDLVVRKTAIPTSKSENAPSGPEEHVIPGVIMQSSCVLRLLVPPGIHSAMQLQFQLNCVVSQSVCLHISVFSCHWLISEFPFSLNCCCSSLAGLPLRAFVWLKSPV